MKLALQIVLLVFACISAFGFIGDKQRKEVYLLGATVFTALLLVVQVYWR